jgi:hypothetical protein
MEIKYIKIETFIPEEYVNKLREELNKVGVLTTDGLYDNCMAVSRVLGSWRALSGSHPFIGEVGKISFQTECKVEFSCKREQYNEAVSTINKFHPYEKPVINVIGLLSF